MLKNIILLLRPHQWVKNLFCFIPLFFGRHLFDAEYILPCCFAFMAYCIAASGIYCFNDIYDAEADKKHPVKCKRPIASGAVGKPMAYIIMLGCFIAAFGIALAGQINLGISMMPVFAIIAFYILLNIAYCIRLKHIAIVDVFIIAVGFVLRVLIGGLATSIALSQWIILMTFLLALFLALAKRRDDVVMYEDTGIMARRNVNRYSVQFMNQAISIIASITMVSYIMYTVSPEVLERFNTSYLYATSIFVLAGILRYLQITIVDVKSGSPTKVLIKDRFIHACIAGWLLAFLIIIYF